MNIFERSEKIHEAAQAACGDSAADIITALTAALGIAVAAATDSKESGERVLDSVRAQLSLTLSVAREALGDGQTTQ